MSAARRATRAGRILAYLNVMFPPIPMLIGAALIFAAVYFFLEALSFHARLAYTWRAVGGIFTGWSMSLMLRVYDELKDVETDRRLAATGDPKYTSRPIPQGTIDVEDLRFLQRLLFGFALVVNLFLGPAVFAAFAVLFLSIWLSSRWFFWPPMKDHLLIAFATHNPLTLLLQVYGTVIFVSDFGAASVPFLPVAAALIAQQGLASAWEVARKIRAPEEETDYVTYSKVLGWRAAPLIPAVAVVVTTACILWVSVLADLHPAYLAAVAIASAVTLGALLRFRLAPSPKTAKLRVYVEAFGGVVNVGAAIALVARWGMTLVPIK